MSDRIGVMSAGKLQQVGPPREIYTRPVNRFVASFIGETNFLSATRDGTSLRLSGAYQIDLPAGCTVAQGAAVTVTIRPEQVRVGDALDSGAIAATITALVYIGTDTHCHMITDNSTQIVARLQSAASGEANYTTGQRVGLRFAPGAAQVLVD